MDDNDRGQRFDHVSWKHEMPVDQPVVDFTVRKPFRYHGMLRRNLCAFARVRAVVCMLPGHGFDIIELSLIFSR